MSTAQALFDVRARVIDYAGVKTPVADPDVAPRFALAFLVPSSCPFAVSCARSPHFDSLGLFEDEV
jgi:hypothetical protein